MSAMKTGGRAIVAVVAVVLVGCAVAWGMRASELRGLRVLHTHFTCRVQAVEGRVGTKNPDKARMLVLTIGAERDSAEREDVFARDFVLCYRHRDGGEDRAMCDVIAALKEDYKDWFVGMWRYGVEPRVQVEGKRVRLALAFLVENDVEEVELWRIGTEEILKVPLGEREFSAYVCTERDRAKAERIARALGDEEGIAAWADTGLRNCSEPTVLYGVKVPKGVVDQVAEAVAREIGSQPTKRELGANYVTEYDFLVWLPDE